MCFEVRRAQADCQVHHLTTAATFRETAYVRSAKRLEQARGKPPPATERWALHWAVGRGRSFEQQPTNRAFLKLLPLFRQSNIAHLLGFKLQYFQDAEVVIDYGAEDELTKLEHACVDGVVATQCDRMTESNGFATRWAYSARPFDGMCQ